MTSQVLCNVCHAELPPGDLGGLCPQCLLRVGLEADGSRHLHVRCPHCHHPVEIVEEAPLVEITCPSCDTNFSLVGDATIAREAEAPPAVGRFELLERLGVGAFGSVWKARDPELDRVVALKLPRKEQLSAGEAEAFLREARSAAQLRHPHIVGVHEVGREGDRVYIVSDYVDGVTLAEHMTRELPAQREAARLCAQLAEALEYAHCHGVVHRDLKPSNILLDRADEPHITDFGLAKREVAEITVTVDGRVLGTPAYMAPEQARGEGHLADGRADVYSLGVILFELLTGEKPFRGSARMLLEQVLHDEPPSPRKLNSRVPRDLETICLKCLEKDPRRRYQDAEELARDLRRYLAGEPIVAHPAGMVTRAAKWARRRPAVAALLVVSLTSAVLIATAAVFVARSEQDRRQEAERSAQQEAKLRAQAVAEADLKRRHLYAAHVALAHRAIQQSFLPTAAELLERQLPAAEEGAGQDDLRSFEWHYLWRLCQDRVLEIDAECGTVMALRFAADGKTLFSKGADYQLRQWDVDTGKQLWHAESSALQGAVDLVIDSDAGTLISRELSGASLWDLNTHKKLGAFKEDTKKYGWYLPASDGRHLLLVGKGEQAGQVLWLDVADGSITREVTFRGSAKTWSADGRTLGSLSGGKVRLLDLESGETREFPFEDAGYSTRRLALSPRGGRALVGAWNLTRYHWFREEHSEFGFSVEGRSEGGGAMNFEDALLYDTTDGKQLGRITGHYRGLTAVAFSPDEKLLATASEDSTVRLWDADTGALLAAPLWHAVGATALAFSADGALLASGGHDGMIKAWPVAQPEDRVALGSEAEVLDLAVSGDGKTIAAAGRMRSGDNRGAVWLLDTASGRLVKQIEQPQTVTSLAFHPRRPLLAWGTWVEKPQRRAYARWWDVEQQATVCDLKSPEYRYPTAVRFSDDGRQLLIADDDNAWLWDVATKQRVSRINYEPTFYQWPAVSPDRHEVAFGDWVRGKAPRFALPGGEELPALGTGWQSAEGYSIGGRIGENTVKGAYSADGRLLALPARTHGIGGADKIELIDVQTGKLQATLQAPSVDFMCAAFAPDGRTVVTGTRDGALLFWDPATGEQRMRLDAHDGIVSSLAFTPDGETLVSAGWDGTVRFHRVRGSWIGDRGPAEGRGSLARPSLLVPRP